MMDIFSFMKGKDIEIDIQSEWFQDLWYPMSNRTGSLVTTRVLTWLGYEGEYKIQRQSLVKLLNRNNIPYEEVDYNDERFREHEVMIKEIADTDPKVVKNKRWIVMTVRNFKKAVLRLNTKNAETIRDYYLNLEEICFEYAEYQAQWLRDKADKERQIAVQKQQMADDELNRKIAQLAIKDKSEEELQAKLELAEQAKEEERQRAELAEQAKDEAEQAMEEERQRAELAEQAKEEAEQAMDEERQRAEKAERKALNVKKFMNRISIKESKQEWIYIGTTDLYAQERLFKIGSTTRLTNRIPQYNTGRVPNDLFYYVWAMKCYNAKDLDFHIQKLLADFKYRDPKKGLEEQSKDNRSEMYHGIKFTDLTAILTFIINNYDKSIECIIDFIKNRLDQSLEEEDEIPKRLDVKLTCRIGDHEEVVDASNEEELKKIFKDIVRCIKEQQACEDGLVVVDRRELIGKLSPLAQDSKLNVWNKVKKWVNWKGSKTELEFVSSDEDHEADEPGPSRGRSKSSPFKYKIQY
jgi:hypothetical protein